MTRLVRIEQLKLRTVRVTYGLLATAAVLTALFASIEAARAGSAGSGVKSLATAAGLTTVTTVTGWSMLFAGMLGVVLSSGEFRHSSATLTYLATPNRVRVLIAKTLAAAGVGAIFGMAATVIATGVGLIYVASHGYHVTLSTETMIGHGAGTMLGAALLAAVGVGLGSLIRSQLAAVIAIFVWGIVIESVIGGLFTSIRPYLPYTAATTLGGIKLGNAGFGPAHGVAGGAPLPFVAAAALVAGVAILISAVAARTTLQHDIT
jgi:ABC-2 type transport system permease protein